MHYIYEMDLHDSIGIEEGISITRVPGGWIYTLTVHSEGIHSDGKWHVNSVFVPYHNEFKKEINEKEE